MAKRANAPSSTGDAPERKAVMSKVSLDEKIPNNVDLSSDKRLQRALEQWQPGFLDWWREMGPDGFQSSDVYLRTAISVDSSGWAHFGMVRMPEYRWGIFLADPEADRTIGLDRKSTRLNQSLRHLVCRLLLEKKKKIHQ